MGEGGMKAMGAEPRSPLRFIDRVQGGGGWEFCREWSILIELHTPRHDTDTLTVDVVRCTVAAAILRHRQWVSGFVKDSGLIDFKSLVATC